VHLLSRHADGAILQELFTRDGVGTLVASDSYETIRRAGPADLGGILELVRPLAEAGVLVGRGRERLESELDHYWVMERDGLVVGTAALYPYPEAGVAELGCLAVHPDYRGGGRGDRLLGQVSEAAREQGLGRLVVLTTQTTHWFRERGFVPTGRDALPEARRAAYDAGRGSKVLERPLEPGTPDSEEGSNGHAGA
jgi:amino-acid N-acetyltransferase